MKKDFKEITHVGSLFCMKRSSPVTGYQWIFVFIDLFKKGKEFYFNVHQEWDDMYTIPIDECKESEAWDEVTRFMKYNSMTLVRKGTADPSDMIKHTVYVKQLREQENQEFDKMKNGYFKQILGSRSLRAIIRELNKEEGKSEKYKN